MRRNARQGRYSKPEILEQLEKGHRYFQDRLRQSTLKKSTEILSNAQAKKSAQIHQKRLKGLLGRFDQLAEASQKSSSIAWYTIPHLRRNLPQNRPIPKFRFDAPPPKKKSSLCSCSMFKKVLTVGLGVGVTALTGLALSRRLTG